MLVDLLNVSKIVSIRSYVALLFVRRERTDFGREAGDDSISSSKFYFDLSWTEWPDKCLTRVFSNIGDESLVVFGLRELNSLASLVPLAVFAKLESNSLSTLAFVVIEKFELNSLAKSEDGLGWFKFILMVCFFVGLLRVSLSTSSDCFIGLLRISIDLSDIFCFSSARFA